MFEIGNFALSMWIANDHTYYEVHRSLQLTWIDDKFGSTAED